MSVSSATSSGMTSVFSSTLDGVIPSSFSESSSSSEESCLDDVSVSRALPRKESKVAGSCMRQLIALNSNISCHNEGIGACSLNCSEQLGVAR